MAFFDFANSASTDPLGSLEGTISQDLSNFFNAGTTAAEQAAGFQTGPSMTSILLIGLAVVAVIFLVK